MRKTIEEVMEELEDEEEFANVKAQGKALITKMQAWDEEMVQRKSKAYDDVENFPNKFTAEYIFLINQTESQIPRVNEASRERLAELNTQWKLLEAKAVEILEIDVPNYNKQLSESGIGVVR
jgi:hypothetical protein